MNGGRAYNEGTFRYFLALERKRSRRSGRPFLLLLVDLSEQPGTPVRMALPVATQLFSSLWRCFRETDLVGWYREGRVAGAMLTELGEGRPVEVSRVVGQRLSEVLGRRLPEGLARGLNVRVYYPEPERTDSGGGFSPVLQPDGLRLVS